VSFLHTQVWLGRRVEPKPASSAWEAVADSPRPWAVRSPGEALWRAGSMQCTACLGAHRTLHAWAPTLHSACLAPPYTACLAPPCTACLAPTFRCDHQCLLRADGSTPLNAHCKLVPAKQRVTVSFVVDCIGAVSLPDYMSRCAADVLSLLMSAESSSKQAQSLYSLE
jgi:hypothetical protein